MSYTPTEWESTDVVTATRMNALETAVGDMNMSYTPNVWSDGDILSAEKMNALEQAVASGGGGSSDFSTCTVTVTTTAEESSILVAYIEEAFLPFVPNATIMPYNNVYPDAPITLTVALYKGHATGFLEEGATATITGSITRNGTNLDITGDGTIAIS